MARSIFYCEQYLPLAEKTSKYVVASYSKDRVSTFNPITNLPFKLKNYFVIYVGWICIFPCWSLISLTLKPDQAVLFSTQKIILSNPSYEKWAILLKRLAKYWRYFQIQFNRLSNNIHDWFCKPVCTVFTAYALWCKQQNNTCVTKWSNNSKKGRKNQPCMPFGSLTILTAC